MITFTDISELKQTEAKLRTAVLENRDLLAELQHRAKNSFAMISALISQALSATGAVETHDILGALDARVRAFSELYSLLSSSGTVGSVRLDEYCPRVVATFVARSGDIACQAEIDPVVVPTQMAIPIGLLLTEMVTNSVKHAFPDSRRGIITIRLKASNGKASLEVSDDGIGMPVEAGARRRRRSGAQTDPRTGEWASRPTQDGKWNHRDAHDRGIPPGEPMTLRKTDKTACRPWDQRK